MQGPCAFPGEATDSSRFETRHIERDAGVTSNSVAFSASSMSAVAIASLSPRLVASSQPRWTNLPVTSGATSKLTTTTPCCLLSRHRRVRSAPRDSSLEAKGARTKAPSALSRARVPAGRDRFSQRTGPRGRSIVTGGAGAAIECVALLSSILGFAVRRGLRSDNPALGIELRRRSRRRHPTADEFARLGDTLAEMEADRADPFALAAIRFLCLSGCRKGEALGLKWEHVDFGRGVLCLPDTKVGPRDIPIGLPALDLLNSLPRMARNPFVFPGRVSGQPLVGLQKVWQRVDHGARPRATRARGMTKLPGRGRLMTAKAPPVTR